MLVYAGAIGFYRACSGFKSRFKSAAWGMQFDFGAGGDIVEAQSQEMQRELTLLYGVQ